MGQGLAGTCLALQLAKRKKSFVVIDQPSKNISSVVAAGLFNPITGKFLKKSWLAEKLFPYLFEFYVESEKALGEKFFLPMPIYRPFETIEEQNDWMAKSESIQIKTFVKNIFNQPQWIDQVHNPFGGLLIDQSGYVNVNSLLSAARNLFLEHNQFVDSEFDFKKLNVSDSKIEYENFESVRIIFCEGISAKANPYLHWLPIRPMKGEVLGIRLEQTPHAIFNRGVYIVPNFGNNYNVGATYGQPPFTESVTEEGRTELDEKLKALIAIPYHVVDQRWGIRPTSPDRRPIIGCHPVHKNIFIFNGLGTKGVSLAPYFSHLLAKHLTDGDEIMGEVNIQRFYPLYSGLR